MSTDLAPVSTLNRPHTADAGLVLGSEVLSFRLGDEEYGVSLLCVQELRSFQAPTRVPGATAELLGVLDLRGEVVPLLDLRRRFGLPAIGFDSMTVTIVVCLGSHRVGVVVDRVHDVVALQPGQIRPVPDLRGHAEGLHLIGVASLPGRTLLLLDIEALLRKYTDMPRSPSH